ncbi:MarR family winged helix-turn-helix transcriptional regulator [Pseudomonas kurunegalensis]|uniref:MarR family winged helix-turn-helix transcriptional regulator n=1 Tax=Pseudomonas kurunegalensis TaxID=485880 RepID=UPI0025701F1F|nr:MarR family transcriptional regulator [Pseudomonas kurunegalensis]WJD65140.1 MarR family transcriptional regulator [Pseudomonas kurunegalensis]
MNSEQMRLIDETRKRLLVISQIMRREAEALPITTTQGAVLSLLQVSPMTVSELAAAEGIRTPTMSQILSRMEESDWIERPQGAGKGKPICLTTAGKLMCEEVRTKRNHALKQRFKSLSKNDLDNLQSTLALLDKLMGAPKC